MHLKISCCVLLSIAISMVYSKSITVNKNKAKSVATKDSHQPKKRISTQQKIGSGHAKGPMANNVQSSVPLPVVMPFPMIPFDDRYPILFPPNGKKKGRGKKKDPKDETEDETDKDVDDEKDGGGDKQYKAEGKVQPKPQINKAPKDNSAPLEEPGVDEDENDKEVTSNSKNYKISNAEEDQADEEEEEEEAEEEDHKSLEKDEGALEHETKQSRYGHSAKTKPKHQDKPRSRRNAFEPIIGNPEDIMPYLMLDSEAETATDEESEHAVKTRSVQDALEAEFEVPHVIDTRDVNEEEEPELPDVISTKELDEEEDTPRDIRTRSVPDEVPDLQAAEKKFKDAEVAAEALTQIQKALGANPNSAVEESHSMADYLRKETEQYDEEIASDIIETQKAQTRSKIVVNDDGTKRDMGFATAKRKLDSDRAKEQQLHQELKELKDIEFMTTELELAKYLAMENARHELQFAQAVNRARVNQAPAPAAPSTEYSPMVLQQPAVNEQPLIPQAAQQPMAASWQPVYPPAITYAYSPAQEAERNSFESRSRTRGPIDSSNIFTQHQDNAYFTHDYQPPNSLAAQNNVYRPNKASFYNQPKYQSTVERPRLGLAVHTEAQSRHIKKPVAFKPRPYQQRFAKTRPAQETAGFAGSRRPTVSFPGPTYSPPPFATRNSRPRLKKNRNRPHYTGYQTQNYNTRASSPALMSFFTDQNQMHPNNNFYQISPLSAQQQYPMYSSSYRAPVSFEHQYDQQNHHYIEKEPEHFNAHSFFTATPNQPQAQSTPVRTEHKPDQRIVTHAAAPIRQQAAAPSRPNQATAYTGLQQKPSSQYTQLRPQVQSYGPVPVFPIQASPAPQSVAAVKEGIPSMYQPFTQPRVQMPYSQPVAQQMPQPFYPQSSRPFETMDTDSTVFHGQAQPVNQQQQQQPTHMANPDEIPLGYGLFPLPEGAEDKMEPEDREVKEVYEHIKDDKEKLQETKQAANAVTKIENKVGFDPGSIAKLVDFVKQAAVKDVDLSDKAVKRDKLTIKRMEIAHATESSQSKDDANNVVTKEAYGKLKVDQELLRESKDRLDKIKRMELIVTGIEAAKYSAMLRKGENLDKDVNKINHLKAAKKTRIGARQNGL